jgi:polynucleotide 5'-kinase involved in rRNA processing
MGIGTLQEIDYLRKTLKIFTPVSGEIAVVVIGKVKLDKNLKETPAFSEDEDFSSLRRLF